GPEPAILHLLPTIWFRNTWSWGYDNEKPYLRAIEVAETSMIVETTHHTLGTYLLFCEGADNLLFTENESNSERLWGTPNATRFVKDSINDAVIQNRIDLVNANEVGTKAAAHYRFLIAPGESVSIRLHLRKIDNHPSPGDSVASLSLR